MAISAADREFRLGIWKIHILHHAAERAVWGTWLLEELAEHGQRVSPGTLYPAITRMEKNGWIRNSGRAAHAKARRTLRITPRGRALLESLRREVAELHREIVLSHRSRHSRAVRGRNSGASAARPAVNTSMKAGGTT